MILRHQAVQVVDEALTRVLRILVVLPDVDRLDRTLVLPHAAADAADRIDLVAHRVALPLAVLAGARADAVRRADRGAEAARAALRPAVRMHRHAVGAAPAVRERRLHVRVLDGDLL